MSNLVNSKEIEEIIGAPRNRKAHFGKLITAEDKIYIMHSYECVFKNEDLRQCEFSKAMDHSTPEKLWNKFEDKTVLLGVMSGSLVPLLELNEEGRVNEND